MAMSKPTSSAASAISIPYRQIRASYDDDTIIVYQAYSAEIAIPAVKEQKLSASPAFKFTRMTWIKPSWCWMMYRSGYSYKDKGQAHILALKMKHEHFHHLLSLASVTTHGILSEEEKARSVRVQWDPERSPSLDVLPYRSIQIGISNQICEKWVDEWIVSIEDVTSTARALKQSLEEGITELEELEEKGLHPKERIYEIPENLREILKMNARD